MNKFIFKSANRLVKNSSNTSELNLTFQFGLIKAQNRQLRQDMVDIKLMLNKLLIDKHLQMQVDEYFDDKPEHPPIEDLD